MMTNMIRGKFLKVFILFDKFFLMLSMCLILFLIKTELTYVKKIFVQDSFDDCFET